MRIQPELKLLCHVCGWRPSETQTIGEIQQHMKNAHNTEKVSLDLSAVCTCGSEMRMKFTESRGSNIRFRDHYICSMDGNEGWIERKVDR